MVVLDKINAVQYHQKHIETREYATFNTFRLANTLFIMHAC